MFSPFDRLVPRGRALAIWVALGWLGGAAHGANAKAPVDFNRDIRPILSDQCYTCHGPDSTQRKSGLRLDLEVEALGEFKPGKRAFAAGDVGASLAIARVESADPDEVMPPPDSGKSLSAAQRELLRRWVAEGAKWEKHWAFLPPKRAELPAVSNKEWARNEIDQFVLARQEAAGVAANPEAPKAALARRATLDLTGLPPTLDEVDAFLADTRTDAYERLVDRLLASPAHGERMAVHWLDLARYADTSGYHFDGYRHMSLWRDWVIGAFNENMPFDQFTVEQLAGDMLPEATVSQRIASGFHRNVMTNDEGGADPNEYLNKYVVDRVNTTGAVWLGLTVGCAECHDHKYDPMKMKDFYQLYAMFHNVPERGLDGTRTENPQPRLPVPTQDQATRMVELELALKGAEQALKSREGELAGAQQRWEEETLKAKPDGVGAEGLLARFGFDQTLAWADGSGLARAAEFSGGSPAFAEGRRGGALELGGASQFAQAASVPALERDKPFSFGGWALSRGGSGALLSRMDEESKHRGYDLLISDGVVSVHLVHQWPENAIKVQTKKKIAKDQWTHLFATWDGSSKAAGLKIYINGEAQELETASDKLSETIVPGVPFFIGKRSNSAHFNGLVDEVRVYGRTLGAEEVQALALEGLLPAMAVAREQRSPAQAADLRQFFVAHFAGDYKAALSQRDGLARSKEELFRKIPNVMVMEEMGTPRDTFMLIRGSWQDKGEKVAPGVPGFLPPLPEGAPANRLGLARWLVAPEQPLASRVMVNRLWAMLFGTGLVKTVNDFGSQGEWPSHPELLDWLAAQFRDGGGSPGARPWDVKAMLKLMVTSATYRQAATARPEALERDPYNRLLARGPRIRLDAEFVRDNALAISGLLNRKIGGESVKPYQPAGLWDVTDSQYAQSKGADLYRRGLYVFWKRAVHYPSFATFDAPSRETCTAQRPRTSTPLQSLVLMNDPVYVEAARGLAERVLRECPGDDAERLRMAFKLTLARPPEEGELRSLTALLEDMSARYAGDAAAAEALLAVGEHRHPEGMDRARLAAHTAVANVLLNLNETITK